tara:strand:- start:435 stop:1415 length:981 start_codon:yes stop_codon:yes gene_type:complete
LYKKVSIIGCGSWGMAIANHISKNVHVELIHYNKKFIDQLITSRVYSSSFKFRLSENIKPAYELNTKSDLLIFASPVQFINSYQDLDLKKNDPKLLILSKGIDSEKIMLPKEIFEKDFNINSSNIAVLSGPSHAEQLFKKDPTSLVVASTNKNYATDIQKFFSNNNMRVYTSTDTTGVQLGGAIKNVIAIAAGIMYGLGLKENSISALITRGLFELKKLGIIMGSEKDTLNGLSGLGDLMATCFSDDSRNRKAGIMIAKGKSLSFITETLNIKAEGLNTCKSIYKLSQKFNIKLPICESVYDILYDSKNPKTAISELMIRDLKREF